MRNIGKPVIDRQGGAIAFASGIASNPGTIYAASALAGMAASPNLAAVREMIINLVGKHILLLSASPSTYHFDGFSITKSR